ncbi:TonB-dependent receptor plug domain-containing protein [bacterium]|nr:TonB-dependent receptor plug domain-containing protein [bacterium]
MKDIRQCVGLILSAILITPALAQDNVEDSDLASLEALLNIKVSTASKYEQFSYEAPASISIVTSDDIRAYGYRTLDELLNTIRGFYISNDRNYEYVGVRGFSRPSDYNNRTLFLLNGHSLNESVYGSAPFGTYFGLDLRLVDRVEIIRGPGSALYGTSAMFAVINVITRDGNTIGWHRIIH